MRTRVLVTGAGGNVGREVVRACVARGLDVRAGDRSAGSPTDSPDVEFVRFDFLDRQTWPAALSRCDHLFLLRPPPLGDMKTTLIPLVDAAYAAGVRHIVFLSVAGAEKNRWVPHHKVEQHLNTVGKAWSVLRPGFFAQNLEGAYRADIVEDKRLYVPAGDGRVAFVDVRDIGDVAAHIFASPDSFRGRALTLTGPEAVSFHEVARHLTEVLGSAVRYEAASLLGYAWHLRLRRKLPAMQIAVQALLHFGLRQGDAELVDPTVENILGRPAGSLRAYVERTAPVWQRRRTRA